MKQRGRQTESERGARNFTGNTVALGGGLQQIPVAAFDRFRWLGLAEQVVGFFGQIWFVHWFCHFFFWV
jgi:hypothetical protein